MTNQYPVAGLRQLISSDGFLLSGVSRLDVTGCFAGDLEFRSGFRNDALDATCIIPGGSVIAGRFGCIFQSFSVRGNSSSFLRNS